MKFPGFRRGGKDSGAPKAVYTVTAEDENLRVVMARGDHPRVTQVVVELTRALNGPVGVAWVELLGAPREWVHDALSRADVLRAVLSIRDLLGCGYLDFAVFSSGQGVEIYLDRFATLEVRTGDWEEPKVRGVLESQGFCKVSRLSVLPEQEDTPPSEAIEAFTRLAAARKALGLRGPSTAPGAEDAS